MTFVRLYSHILKLRDTGILHFCCSAADLQNVLFIGIFITLLTLSICSSILSTFFHQSSCQISHCARVFKIHTLITPTPLSCACSDPFLASGRNVTCVSQGTACIGNVKPGLKFNCPVSLKRAFCLVCESLSPDSFSYTYISFTATLVSTVLNPVLILLSTICPNWLPTICKIQFLRIRVGLRLNLSKQVYY